MKRYLVMSILSTVSIYANQPSFDCSKVGIHSTEHIICTSNKLMNLDKELADTYKKAKNKAKNLNNLKAMQRGWIKGRNECWKENDEMKCIENAYHSRIHELKKKYAIAEDKTTTEHKQASYSFDKTLSLQGISFHITTTGEGSIRQLTIKPSGLKIDNEAVSKEIDGSVTGAEVADLNADGSPELYIYVTSSGSGAYGSVIAYSTNHKKSMSGITMPELAAGSKDAKGYMGHDEFAVIENSLARRFPIYNENDSNAKPTGGTRQLQYKLKMGEALWQLQRVKSTEF